LQKRTSETTQRMLDDLCSNYTLRNSTADELTELAYILFECMKQQLAQKDLLKLSSKWRDLSSTYIFKYLVASASAQKQQNFLIVANLVRSLTNFDALYEAKLVTHVLLDTSSEAEAKCVTL
jgi:hypothetical protein